MREFSTRRLDDSSYGEARYRVSWYNEQENVKVRAEIEFWELDDKHSHVEAIRHATGLAVNQLEPVFTDSTIQQWYKEKGN